jgi:hypothetical protein
VRSTADATTAQCEQGVEEEVYKIHDEFKQVIIERDRYANQLAAANRRVASSRSRRRCLANPSPSPSLPLPPCQSQHRRLLRPLSRRHSAGFPLPCRPLQRRTPAAIMSPLFGQQ